MSARYYDVVLLGRSLGTLLTAALLARRELRVLVLGQGQYAPRYQVEGYSLARRAFTFLASSSPTFKRILQELAQTQRFRQLTQPLDPMFGVLDGRTRFHVPPHVDSFSQEIQREYPEVQQQVAELYSLLSEANGRIDRAWEKDAIWPPASFWERLETARLSAQLPFVDEEEGAPSLLARLPQEHGFRRVVELSALFGSHQGLTAGELPALALARLHGSWTRGVQALPRDEQDLEDFLIERIESHGGTCRLYSRASSLILRHGRIAGVQEEDEPWVTGASSIVTNLTGEALAELTQGEGITRRARDVWPEVTTVGFRYVVNLIAYSQGLPAPLPRESFLVSPAPSLPTVHLKRGPLLSEGNANSDAAESPPGSAPKQHLVAEMLLPLAGGLHVLGARQAVLATLRHYFPFLEEHCLLIDSPHDGLPAWHYASPHSREPRELDRVHLQNATTQAEPMDRRLSIAKPGYLHLAGEPIRGPIPGTYLVGPSVLPSLGQEGEVLAAWSAARLLTQKDKSRQKLRRQMWTKIETP